MKYLLQFLHISIVLACVLLLGVEAKTCLERYLQKETRAVLKVEPTGQNTFLAFTICPAYEHAYKENILTKLGTSREQIRSGNFSLEAAGATWVQDKIFEQITHDFKDVVEEIRIFTEHQPITLKTEHINSSLAKVVPLFGLTLGRCFSLEFLPILASLEIRSMQMIGNINFYVYFHHPFQFLDKDTKTKVHVTVDKMIFLDLAYEITENTLSDESLHPCNADQEYNYDDCHYKVLNEKLMDKIGCLVPSLPPKYYSKGANICVNMSSEEIKELKKYFKVVAGQRHCIIPCKTMEVPIHFQLQKSLWFIKKFFRCFWDPLQMVNQVMANHLSHFTSSLQSNTKRVFMTTPSSIWLLKLGAIKDYYWE